MVSCWFLFGFLAVLVVVILHSPGDRGCLGRRSCGRGARHGHGGAVIINRLYVCRLC